MIFQIVSEKKAKCKSETVKAGKQNCLGDATCSKAYAGKTVDFNYFIKRKGDIDDGREYHCSSSFG